MNSIEYVIEILKWANGSNKEEENGNENKKND